LTGASADLHERQLQLRESLANWRNLSRGDLLQQRKLRSDRLDRDPDLHRITLGLGAGHKAGAPHSEVDQRHHVLEQDLLDRDLRDLGFVGGTKLFLGGLPPPCLRALAGAHRPWISLTRAHRVTSAVPSCPAYVRLVSSTIAA
jgi:hypothetical protein